MPNFLNDHVEEMLRQAEHRLQSNSPVPAPMRLQSQLNTSMSAKDAASSEKLSVRQAKQAYVSKKGANVHELPNATQEVTEAWKAIRLRGILDPKNQKKTLREAPPAHAHVGTIIEGPTEFYSARLARKERKRSMLDEVIRDADSFKLKAKFSGIQEKKASGKKGFYKNLMTQRRKKR